ncbi:MAG: tetratricopeptide repeat protein [Chitinophagales bacterium]
MSEKLLDIFRPQADCIPEDMLTRYAGGALSSAEKRIVEEHLSECVFCSDAMDGIMQEVSVQKFHSQLSALKKKVHNKTKSAEHASTFPYTRLLAVAATLLLLAICAWYVQYAVNNNPQKLFISQFEPYPVPQITKDMQQTTPGANDSSAALDSKDNTSLTDTYLILPGNEKVKTPEKKDVLQIDAIKPQSKIAANHEVAPSAEGDVMQPLNPDSFNASSEMKNNDAEAPQPALTSRSNAASQEQAGDEIQSQNNSMANDHFSRAMSSYQTSFYAEALTEFQSVLKLDPDNAPANFYAGVSLLAMNNAIEALIYFGNTDQADNPFYEATLWYQALSYISLEDKKQAAKLLEKVIKLHGEYKKKAEETLRQL